MLRDALEKLDVELPFVELPVECIALLREHAIPEDIINDLRQCALPPEQGWLKIGPLSLVPMPDIINQNTHGISRCIENGCLAVAGCCNGDPVVVDRQTRQMLFVSHELLWSHKEPAFRECVLLTPYIYDDFWEAAVTDPQFPWDYYEAERQWSPDKS